MVLYSFIEIAKTIIGNAKVGTCTPLFISIFHLMGNIKMLLMVLYGLFKFTERVICIAKVSICISFATFVFHFFRSAQLKLEVLYGCLEISELKIPNAITTMRLPFCSFFVYLFFIFLYTWCLAMERKLAKTILDICLAESCTDFWKFEYVNSNSVNKISTVTFWRSTVRTRNDNMFILTYV